MFSHFMAGVDQERSKAELDAAEAPRALSVPDFIGDDIDEVLDGS